VATQFAIAHPALVRKLVLASASEKHRLTSLLDARYFTKWLNKQMVTATSDPISSTFAALADPTRRAILSRLASGEASVTELAEPFRMSLPGVSKHLKVLERAGLIVRSREAQWRPCRLQAGPLKEADEWLERYRRHWEESFDRLDSYLRELQ
jgi:DNA-binding transcriptional ArsR family regulator